MKFDKHKIIRYIGIVSLLLLVFIAVSYYFDNRAKGRIITEKEQLETTLNETIKYYTDQDGKQVARIGVLESSKLDYLYQLKSKDSTVLKLQRVVKLYEDVLDEIGASATVFTSETVVSGSSDKTEVVGEIGDPIYKNSFNFDEWVYGSSIATKNGTDYNIRIKNEYSLVLGYDKQGFLGLGKPKPFADITSYNPHSTVKTIRSYRVTEPIKQLEFSFGPQTGVGLTSNLKPTGYIGFGVTMTLFKIKI